MLTPELAGTRQRLDLNGRWELALDQFNRGRKDGWFAGSFPNNALSVSVPSLWNTAAPGYEGVVFYRRRCLVPPAWLGKRVRLLVSAANYYAEFWVNGRHAGDHEGGYTPFALDVTDLVAYGRENELVARVVDPPIGGRVERFALDEVACAKETWYYRYGGLWGDVSLEASSASRISDCFVCPDLSGRPSIQLRLALQNQGAVSLPVSLRAIVRDSRGAVCAFAEQPFDLGGGESVVEFPLTIAGPIRWAIDSPHIYRCSCTLFARGSALPVDALAVDFGLRTFDVTGGDFLLNGSPVQLKGVLYQPNYPRTLVYPEDLAMAERELRLIKEARFNMVRFHVRPPHPRYLELADRLGLLAYEESALAWISPSEHLSERVDRELREMVMRDRNHPSVVLWGIFNENQKTSKLIGARALAAVRSLDPGRPVVDNSGGAGALDQGGAWCDSTSVLPVAGQRPEPLSDLHLYFAAPLVPEVASWLSRVGTPGRVPNLVGQGYGTPSILRSLLPHLRSGGRIFVSELGCGGLPNLDDVESRYNSGDNLVDAVELRAFASSLSRGLTQRGLGSALGGVAELAAATQALQAEADARQVALLRSNPRVSGYVVTQFNDAAWEFHAGLVDLWRRPKLALAALAAVNQPRLLWVELPRHTALPDEQLLARVAIVNDGLTLGESLLRFTIVSGGSVVTSKELPLDLRQPISSLSFRLPATPAQPGEYGLRAELRKKGGLIALHHQLVTVLPRRDPRLPADLPVHLALPDPQLTRFLGDLPIGLPSDRGKSVLVSRPEQLDCPAWQALLSWVHSGGTAIALELVPSAVRRLNAARCAPPISIFPSLGNYVGVYRYVRGGPLFRDLPASRLAGREYALVSPRYSLGELGVVHAGAFTSKRQANGDSAFVWWADIQSVPMGAGTLILCQYRIAQRLASDPVARILLQNLLDLGRPVTLPSGDCR